MKLPKNIPFKLIYVLLIILIWDRVVENYTNKNFNTKQMDDVKEMLMNKMNFSKEKFEPNDPLDDESMDIQPWLSYQGAPFNKPKE
tara:strand:- start:198 stop:455 length:258 start_codon:yes stop_codon:yes gene_type:complete